MRNFSYVIKDKLNIKAEDGWRKNGLIPRFQSVVSAYIRFAAAINFTKEASLS